MTAKESNFKNKLFSFKYFRQSLRSYWWLGVIAAIVYGIAGPLILWMGMASMNNYARDIETELLRRRAQEAVNTWFHLEGMISYYIIAMFLAVVFALVIWGYLHSKKQINFYHSMPISRTALFINNTLVGIVLNFIPLLLMYVLMIIIGIGYGGASAMPWNWIIVHPLRMFLFFMLSYSLAVLAAQLTGTVLTQFGMSAVLHFGPMCFVLVAIFAMDTFFNTFNGGAAFDKAWALSPLTNVIYWVTVEESVYNNGMYYTLDGLGLKWIMEIVLITVAAFAAAYAAYRQRHSESAGQPLIFEFTKPIVEFIIMFCVATLAGIAFLEVSGKFFFLVGLILFAVLVHMSCQVIFFKDFKSMFANKKYLIGFLAVLLVFFGGMYTDMLGYDKYVPPSDKISAVKVNLSELDSWDNRDYEYVDDANVYTDANDVELLLGMAHQITEKGCYYRNNVLYENNYAAEYFGNDTITLSFTYITASGREISRRYQSVPVEELRNDFAALYNRDSFKKVNYAWLLEAKAQNLLYYSIYNPISDVFYQFEENNNDANYSYYGGFGRGAGEKYAEELLAALKQDVMERKVDTISAAPVYLVDLQFRLPDNKSSYQNYSYYDLPIYACDRHTLAFLDKLAAEENFRPVDYDALAQHVRELDVYQLDQKDIDKMQNLLYGDYRYYDEDMELKEIGMTKTAAITDKKEIARLLAEGYCGGDQYRMASKFAKINTDVFIGIRLNGYVDSNSRWDIGMVLPEQTEI